jgi:hypothetical protein
MIDEGEAWDIHRRTRAHRRLTGKKEGVIHNARYRRKRGYQPGSEAEEPSELSTLFEHK